jgi:methyl-accepting chemotaxis protein
VLQASERKTVSDFVSVDVAHFQRLSREFRNAAAELRERIGKFEEQTANTHGAYGETPHAAEAEREYRETTAQTLDRLEKMHRDLVETADTLQAQAKVFADAATDTELAAAQLDGAL